MVVIGVILIATLCFMRGSQSTVPDIKGNENTVKTFVNSDISLFHYSDLSEKVESYNGIQKQHNTIKYCVLAIIVSLLFAAGIYKCLDIKKQNRRNNEIDEGLEMTTVHNAALMKKGIVSKSYRKVEKQKKQKQDKKNEHKKRRRYEYDSEDEEEVGERKKRNRRKREVEEEVDSWKQENKDIEVGGTGDDKTQKLMSGEKVEAEETGGDKKENKEKKVGKKWRWVQDSGSGSE